MAIGTPNFSTRDRSSWYALAKSKFPYPPRIKVDEASLRFKQDSDWKDIIPCYFQLIGQFSTAEYPIGTTSVQGRYLVANDPAPLQRFSKEVLLPVSICQRGLDENPQERPVELRDDNKKAYLLRYSENNQEILEAYLSVFLQAQSFNKSLNRGLVYREIIRVDPRTRHRWTVFYSLVSGLRDVAELERKAEQEEVGVSSYRRFEPISSRTFPQALEEAALLFEKFVPRKKKFGCCESIFDPDRSVGNLVKSLSDMLDPKNDHLMAAYCASEINKSRKRTETGRNLILEGPFCPRTNEGKESVEKVFRALGHKYCSSRKYKNIKEYRAARPTLYGRR